MRTFHCTSAFRIPHSAFLRPRRHSFGYVDRRRIAKLHSCEAASEPIRRNGPTSATGGGAPGGERGIPSPPYQGGALFRLGFWGGAPRTTSFAGRAGRWTSWGGKV